MTSEQLRVLNLYLIIIVVGAVIGGGGVAQTQLAAGQQIDWPPILAATLGALITGLSTMVLPSLRAAVAEPSPEADLGPAPKPAPVTTERTYTVIHSECGKVAFLTTVPPRAGRDLSAAEARHVDGRPMIDGAPIVCDACGAALAGIKAEGRQWVTVSAPRMLGA